MDVVATRPGRAARLSFCAALAVASATTVLGVTGSPLAFTVGASAAALLASCGGLVVLRAAARGRTGRLARAALGLSAVVWGTGEAMVAVGRLLDPLSEQVATAGDAVCTAAAPLAVVGMLALPLSEAASGRRRRWALDALLIASAGAAVLWQTTFRPISPDPSSTGLAVTVLLADLSVVALALQLALASLDRGMITSAAGLAAFGAGDLAWTYALVDAGGAWPWQSAAVSCLAWPLICAGFLSTGNARSGPRRLQQLGADERTGSVTAVLVVGLAAALAITSGIRGEPLDAVSLVLLVLLLVLLGARELVHQRQRGLLVGDLTRQARQDFLTGAGNRRALAEHLTDLATVPDPTSVIVVDLDGFKDVNDRLGHAVGDDLLTEVARGLRAAVPDEWQVFRPGGDEFALAGEATECQAAGHARAALDSVRTSAAAVAGVGRVALSASAGVAQLHGGSGDPMVALSQASTAMQAAKQAGRDQVVVHTGELAARARDRAAVVRRLREALARDELAVALQPIVRIDGGGLSGFEALSRWDDAELGVVTPDVFVPVAEETGLVVPLGASVLRRGLAALTALGGVEQGLRLSVNASPLELRSPSYASGVQAALQVAGVPADLLTLEVTEAVFVAREDPAVATLRTLADLGVRVAVDDFGTGYSSLSYLGRLPVHSVKIDRSLVSELGDPRTRRIVEALIAMCRALDLGVVGEGVETPVEAGVLRELGVELGQGWLWSRALPWEELRGADFRSVAVASLPSGPAATGPGSRAPLV